MTLFIKELTTSCTYNNIIFLSSKQNISFELFTLICVLSRLAQRIMIFPHSSSVNDCKCFQRQNEDLSSKAWQGLRPAWSIGKISANVYLAWLYNKYVYLLPILHAVTELASAYFPSCII